MKIWKNSEARKLRWLRYATFQAKTTEGLETIFITNKKNYEIQRKLLLETLPTHEAPNVALIDN